MPGLHAAVWRAAYACVALLMCLPVLAHHSYAMFDRTRQVTVSGTVIEFQTVNPHSWLDLTALDASGTAQKWSFECGSYSQVIRRGVRKSTFKVGDKVTVSFFPLRDGRNGGHALTVTAADGKVYEMVPGGL